MKFNKSSAQAGQVSRLLLVLAVIILVAVVIVYLVMKMAERPPAPTPQTENLPQLPVYEDELGKAKFTFLSAIDLGNALRASNLKNQTYSGQKDIPTTEKFIQVTVGAQNEGTENIEQNSWDIGNIIDADGRNFVPMDQYVVGAWLPKNNACGTLLKPAFQPAPCTKIFEVSKKSTGLKIQVLSGKDNTASTFSSGKRDTALLDLIVK
jgi:hypothetical protein